MQKNGQSTGFLRVFLLAAWVLLGFPRAYATDVTLAWDPPTVTSNLVGYVVYYGTTSGSYSGSTNVGNVTTATVQGLTPSTTYYFAASSVDNRGYISDYSTEISYLTPDPVPTLPSLGSVAVTRNVTTSPLAITLGPGGSETNWILSATSSDPLIIANSGLTLGGSSTNRWITLTPVQDAVGSVVITLRLRDSSRTNTATFTATVAPPNLAPVVSAGTNATILTNVTFMLRGRATDDGQPAVPGRVTVQWSKVTGPGTVTFGNSNFMVTTVRFSSGGIYRLKLTATDGQLTSTSEVVVRVQNRTDLTPPIIADYVVSEVTDTTVTLEWLTNELADDQVQYTPEFLSPLNSLLNPIPRLSHTVTISNLTESTTYSFVAKSRDTSLNRTNSDPLSVATLSSSFFSAPVPPASSLSSAPSGYAFDGDDQLQPALSGASFPVEAPVSGVYYVWVRVVPPSNIYQPFSVSLNNGPADLFDPNAGYWRSPAEWILLTGRSGQLPGEGVPVRTLSLSAGTHNLMFSGNDAPASVTRIFISTDPDETPSDAVTLAKLVIPIRSGWSMVACPLQGSSSTVATLMPSPPPFTVFYKYDPSVRDYVANVFNGTTWDNPAMALAPGEGGLVFNPDAPFTWEIRGTIATPTTPIGSLLQTGLNFVSLPVPRAGLLKTVLPGYVFKAGDQLFRMNAVDGSYISHRFDGQAWDRIPVINLGEAFFLSLTPR